MSGKRSSPGLLWQAMAIACAVSVLCALLVLSRLSLASSIDNKGYDLLVSALDRQPPTQRVVMVEIDEESLAKVGPWPWRRDMIAGIIQHLGQAKASVIGLDIVFPETDPEEAADQALGEALRQSRSILGFDFVFDSARNRSSECTRMPNPVAAATPGLRIMGASAIICDLPRLESEVTGTGFLNSVRDRDGMTRRIPLLVAYRGGVYSSFALSAAMADSEKGILLQQPGQPLRFRRKHRAVGPGDGGNLLLRYRGPAGTMPHFPAWQVLAGQLGAQTFAGKIVLIGISVNGLEEYLQTPREGALPGVEMQATAIDNLVAGDYLHRPNWAKAAEIFAIFAVSLFTAWLMYQFSVRTGVCGTLAALSVIWSCSEYSLTWGGAFVSPIPAIAAGMATLFLCAVLMAVSQRRAENDPKPELAVANRFITGALGAMTAVRDVETGQHVVRIQGYLRSLCEVVSAHPKFSDYLTPSMVDLLVQLAPIHDIGKVGVPDYILRKPGALTGEEFDQMKSHVTLGKKILEEVRQHAGLRDEVFFQVATDMVYSHHEWWDGSGYPLGLSSELIPIPGRLLAVADVYDALISRRSYKPELLHAEAVEHIRKEAGSHFDPDVVAGFLAVQDDWRRMAEAHGDEPGMAASAQ